MWLNTIAAIDALILGTSSPAVTSISQSDANQVQIATFEFFELPIELKRRAWSDKEIDAVNVCCFFFLFILFVWNQLFV